MFNILRYERIPTQFTTVIFPDGSQPSPPVTASTSNVQNSNSFPNSERQHINSQDSSTPVGEHKTITTTTTTLSRYLYHRRWIWSSGCSRYSNCSNSTLQQSHLQLARTLSVLTK